MNIKKWVKSIQTAGYNVKRKEFNLQNVKFAVGVQIMQVSLTELALKVTKKIFIVHCGMVTENALTFFLSYLEIFLGVEKNIDIA